LSQLLHKVKKYIHLLISAGFATVVALIFVFSQKIIDIENESSPDEAESGDCCWLNFFVKKEHGKN
jgi:hypothetical protein